MKKIKLLFILVFLMVFNSSCSYKKMNSVDQKKFDIQDFEISGGATETFTIQKKIQRFSNKKSENKIKLIIDLKKNETIKEKNIQNKVTKYNIELSADVKIIDLNKANEILRTFSANQIYSVEDSYSNTVNNSKEANNSLIEKIANEILDQLRIYYR